MPASVYYIILVCNFTYVQDILVKMSCSGTSRRESDFFLFVLFKKNRNMFYVLYGFLCLLY